MSIGVKPARAFDNASRPFLVISVATFWLATAIAATALWPIYRTVELPILVGSALALGTAISVIGARLRWPSPVVMLVTIGAFLLVGVPLAVPSEVQYGVVPTLTGLRDLVAGVALGWKQLLTITVPVGSYQGLLVPALVLILVTTVVGLSVALRSRRPELVVIFPIVVFVVATAFGPKLPAQPLMVPIALTAVVLLWLVWMQWYRRRGGIRSLVSGSASADSPDRARDSAVAGLRTASSAALIVVVASLAAVGVAGVVPPIAERTVLRTVVEQPFDPQNYVSPLSGFRTYWQPAQVDSTLFQVSGLPRGERIRLATMDAYNGVVYSVGSQSVTSQSGSFTRVASTYDQSAVTGTPQTLSVTIGSYAGVWLPTVGKLTSVDFTSPDSQTLRDDFYYNNVSGAAAIVGGLGSGDSYTLSAITPVQPPESSWAELTPGAALVPNPQDVPDDLTATLGEYTTGVSGTGNRLVAALNRLKADGYVSHGVDQAAPPSRSGHASDRISQLFTDQRMIGDGEQYAVAAALMADDIGFPSRVVLGFVPKSERVTGADVAAWIEINTAQYGWVTIDPNPPVRDIPEEVPQELTQIARPQTIVPPPVVESDSINKQVTPDKEQERTPDVNSVLLIVLAVLRVLGVVLGVGAILLAPFLVIVAAKYRRRRRRRRAPTAIQRISGGWQEFENAVADHGVTPPASSTRSEFASAAGGAQSGVLAAITDRAMFSPDPPSSSDAENVWRAVDELHAALDDGLTLWQRLRAKISLRSLGGYSVRNFHSR